mmetsp:Transcript_3558/g.16227  ORF Transcript_3558/g.16227 Transcript_3558/m.16227 type:complete len:211 (+) Transcript_3558:1868-2500(+)
MPPTAWRDAEPREAIAPKGRARQRMTRHEILTVIRDQNNKLCFASVATRYQRSLAALAVRRTCRTCSGDASGTDIVASVGSLTSKNCPRAPTPSSGPLASPSSSGFLFLPNGTSSSRSASRGVASALLRLMLCRLPRAIGDESCILTSRSSSISMSSSSSSSSVPPDVPLHMPKHRPAGTLNPKPLSPSVFCAICAMRYVTSTVMSNPNA